MIRICHEATRGNARNDQEWTFNSAEQGTQVFKEFDALHY